LVRHKKTKKRSKRSSPTGRAMRNVVALGIGIGVASAMSNSLR
jgi:hypothetical protein